MYLSKSDFQLGCDCPQKLVYKKRGYPTANDTNEYMQMLAQGGYIIGTMATMLYPDGIEIQGNTREALAQTRELLQQDYCVLFEAAIESAGKLVRIDILEKKGNQVNLIEVKSKSHDSETDDPYQQKKLLDTYIQDVAYQNLVLSEAHPDFKIRCYLLTPDKAKRTSIEGLAGWFSIKPSHRNNEEVEELPAQARPAFNKPDVVFKFQNDPQKDYYIQRLKNEGILSMLEVTDECVAKKEVIASQAEILLEIVHSLSADGRFHINKSCKGCEFNTPESAQNGYRECWGNLADSNPHIFDLYFGGSIGNAKSGFYLDELIYQKKTSLWDIDKERLKNKAGELSARGQRQSLQIDNTRTQTEWISPDLKSYLRTLTYPLHFIDFETYLGALPFHANMRPYELLAFQWSCHTIPHPGAEPIHHEWIHTGSDFPNFEFAKALKKVVGDNGTPLMWATHENTVLRTILEQIDTYKYNDEALRDWLTKMTQDKSLGRTGRLVDMNKLTLDGYFHPLMKGRTSIKKVLPAVWSSNTSLHAVSHFQAYSKVDDNGRIIDPYDTLMPHSANDTGDDVVNIGTAAMRAYYRMRFDDSLNADQKQELQNQLLAYCKLDTLSMVIIAHHWGLK